MNWATGLILVTLFSTVGIWLFAEWRAKWWIRRVDSITRGKAHQMTLPNRYEK